MNNFDSVTYYKIFIRKELWIIDFISYEIIFIKLIGKHLSDTKLRNQTVRMH